MICEAQIKTENVDKLKKIIDSFLKKEQEYLSEINILKEQILCLQDRLFGRKSEKTSSGFQQRFLFETSEDHFPIAEQPEEDEIEIQSHKRKKRGRKPIPANLPRIEVIHDVDEAEKQWKCGCQKECIGQEVSEQLDIVPAKIQVIRNIRLKYACKNCEGVESDGPTVTIAQMPEQLISKCIGTPGLIAFVLAAKFVDALPFYRQEKQFLRIGVKISRATMCSWAHVRRKFLDVVKASGKPNDGKKKSGTADQALKYIRKLYKIEKDAKNSGLTNNDLIEERQEKAKPVLDEFKRWLDAKVDEVPPKSLLGKAIAYALNQWHRLVVYADTDHVTPDNNMAENTIRPFVIGRKNWLFAGTPEGAAASAAIYSLFETAKANGLEPYWYFRYLLENLPDAMTEDDYKALLPQYLDQSQLAGPANIS